MNGKDAKETFTTTFCLYPYWKNVTNQPTMSIQANRGERGWLKYKIKTREVSKLSQTIQLDISRYADGTLYPAAQ